MKIKTTDELIREKLEYAAKTRRYYAAAIAKGDSRVAKRCRCSHDMYLREIHILWEMKALIG